MFNFCTRPHAVYHIPTLVRCLVLSGTFSLSICIISCPFFSFSTVPVNKLPEKDGSQRFYQEKISYEHQYNSRWQKNYPIRSTVSVQFIQSHAQLFINVCLIHLNHHSDELPQNGKFIDHRDVYQFWIGEAKTHS